MRTKPLLLCIVVASTLASIVWAGQGAKKVLDHSAYDTWRSISGAAFTRNGEWLMYRVAPAVGDAEVTVRNVSTGAEHKIARGTGARFSYDGKFVVATIVPSKADVDQAKKEKKAPRDMPKNSLGILDLASGKLTTVEKVRSWRMADKASEWLSYSIDEGAAAPAPASGGARPGGGRPGASTPATTAPPTTTPPATAPAEPQDPKKPTKKRDHAAGSELILRNIATGDEKKLADVADHAFFEDGLSLVYSVSTKTGDGDALMKLDLKSGASTEVMKGMARYTQLNYHKSGNLAFLSDREDYAAETPAVRLYFVDQGKSEPKEIAKEGLAGIAKGWWLAKTGVRFSESGKRLIVSIQPRPEPEPKDETPAEEKVEVDIWHWRDPVIQPQQLLQANAERNRSYEAVIHLDSGRIVPIEGVDVPNATISDRGDGGVALASTNVPYRVSSTWAPGVTDVYLIDVATGTRKAIATRFEGMASLSPKGQFALLFDTTKRAWFAHDTKSGSIVEVSKGIPHPVHNELADTPDDAGPYGLGGWTENDRAVLIYDRFDIWVCDPAGRQKPVCLTDGAGRMTNTILRAMNVDREQIAWKPDASMLLSARSWDTESTGIYRDQLGANRTPEKLIFGAKLFGFSTKAEEADRVLITRQDFTEYPNLWLTNMSFQNPTKVSDANPQQAEYNWGKTELVEWTSLEGEKLKGVLVKPENFDPAKKYPMVVYFYERLAQSLHQHRVPAPSASTINPTMFASNGYLVFMPDITYRTGYPGAGAEASILPGVTYLVSRGYVDEKKIGIQGQSWGGYQVAHLITRTNMFAAACAGAPVVNMFSAYGGIRWGSGLLRQMQYEQGQSRIGGSIWEKPLQYIENSPLFWVDRVNTPLLMMNNDKDGAVPWYQGIEFYSALRRQEKPVWLVVYNGEDHNLVQTKNRKDWSVRLHQFFDHYLKDAPPPVWLAEGVPAVKKGRTMGLDLVKPDGGNGSTKSSGG